MYTQNGNILRLFCTWSVRQRRIFGIYIIYNRFYCLVIIIDLYYGNNCRIDLHYNVVEVYEL